MPNCITFRIINCCQFCIVQEYFKQDSDTLQTRSTRMFVKEDGTGYDKYDDGSAAAKAAWDKLTDKCMIKKVGEKVYMATAELKVDWAPYKFKFGDASWTAGTNFGYASESKPGIYDFAKGTPIKLNPNAVFEEVKVTPPHDGKYDFYLDASGDGPVVYIKEHK